MTKTTRSAVISLTASLLLGAAPSHAHHSFPAEYDASKPVKFTGKVTKVEWTNPHIFIYVDVPDEKSGEVVNWTLEMGGPNTLLRLGWKRDSLKVDDLVSVEGSLARYTPHLANASSIVMVATGKKMLAGSSKDQQ